MKPIQIGGASALILSASPSGMPRVDEDACHDNGHEPDYFAAGVAQMHTFRHCR